MFRCDKCGECCRHLDYSPLYSSLHNGDGVCHFLKGNLCSIYENRPIFCRIDECYQTFFKDKLSYEEYIYLNYTYCDIFKRMRRK